jgi:phosphoribosylamine--glycine ligase
MKILIIGKGGREHSLAWKFGLSSQVQQIYVAEGNAGCNLLPKVTTVNLTKIDELLDFAQQQLIDLTFVGSEELLVAGIVDKFQAHGLAIFGANQQAAKLEGSKAFAKQFMNKYGVKTAHHQSFTEYAHALAYLKQVNYPIVIKASGLAAGKGVIIAQDNNEAEAALAAMLLDQVFGESGNEVVIEEYLVGVEASILSFTDGKTITPLISAKDHKKIGEGETGLNTGGMGVIAPNPYVTADIYQAFIDDILQPTLNGMHAEGMDFAGIIFFGLMITANGVYLLEYNMRLGDPETQALLPLLKTDLVTIVNACLNKKLATTSIQWHQGASCCVVLAAEGYPEKYAKGVAIKGIENFTANNCYVFTAGVAGSSGHLVTAGGRVLNIVAIGDDLSQARQLAYQQLKQIEFAGCYYRCDIGVISAN